MIIMTELPFSFVETKGFRRLMDGTVRIFEPKFLTPSRTTLTKDVLEIYKREKQSLRDLFVKEGYRLSLTTDTWTSLQNINYLVLTGHFIDHDWKLHKRILNFCQIENHRGETIEKEVEKCLKQWGIEKILTLIVDNASSNDTAVAYLIRRFNDGLILGGDFLHVRCCAHILNLIVRDGMKDVDESISRIRNVVRFVRSSPARFRKFKKCTEEENISCKKVVCLDVTTRWNSTYMMLEAAEKYEKAFARLEDYDANYLGEVTPNKHDWEVARMFVKFLSVFYEVTLKLSGSLHVTSNIVFREIGTIQNCIRNYTINNDNLILKDIATKMQDKFDKYWGNSDKANFLLYIAMVLDPRYKMRFLFYCFNELFEADVAKDMGKKVQEVFRRLYTEYSLAIRTDPSSISSTKKSSKTSKSKSKGCSTSTNASKDFCLEDKFDLLDECANLDSETELDIYLLEPRVKPNDKDKFNVLDWWKYNSPRYNILSKIARDILAISVSTVASKSAFSMGGRVIDPFRSSLAPTTVEALVCAQNWLKGDDITVDLQQHLDDVINIEEEFKKGLNLEESGESNLTSK